MKRYLHIFAAGMLLLATLACSDGNSQQTPGSAQNGIFRSISPQEAKTLIETRKDIVLVDVRSPDEMYEGSIPGSRLIPFGELARGRMTLPEGQPLLLICAVGGRSFAVGQYFTGKGYGEIYNLSGGISAWKAAGLPLQR